MISFEKVNLSIYYVSITSELGTVNSELCAVNWNHCDDFNWVNKDVIALK